MKIIKAVGIGIGILILALITWIVLINYAPKSWLYTKEIKSGNEFAKNIRAYQTQNNKLPDETDLETLKHLNTVKDYKEWFPDYRKTSDAEFTLTFIKGFDGPYMTYDSKTKIWVMK